MQGFGSLIFVASKKQELTTSQGGQDREKDTKKLPIKSPISEEKSRKQAKNIMRSEVLNLTTEQQINYDQLIKTVLSPQEEVKKLKKDNKKLMEILEIIEQIDSRIMTQERSLNTF